MANREAGKGDKRRPTRVDEETFQNNWERTFGQGDEGGKTCMYSGLAHVENYVYDPAAEEKDLSATMISQHQGQGDVDE